MSFDEMFSGTLVASDVKAVRISQPCFETGPEDKMVEFKNYRV